MSFIRRNAHLIILMVGLVLIYSFTLAPGLTWANRGADGGDLIVAAATNGVAHPSGYPTYLFLAKLFQLIPVGVLAFRTNLMSSVFAVLSALLVSDLARKAYPGTDLFTRWAGFLTGLAFGLSPLFWSQAIITEVYTLHALLIVVILWMMPLSGSLPPKKCIWFERLGSLLFGLALGNQLTVIFLLPLWFWIGSVNWDGWWAKKKIGKQSQKMQTSKLPRVDWISVGRKSLWFLIGLSIYLTIPMRARSGSPVIWGMPVDLKGVWWLISGQLYQERVFSLAPEFIIPRIRNWAGWLQNQYGLIGLAVGFYGLLYGSPRSKRFFWVTGWMLLTYSVFAIGYASSDSYTILIPAFMAFGLWFGLGLATILEKTRITPWASWLTPLSLTFLSGAILINAGINYPKVDASKENLAEIFIQTILENAPENAILLTQDDEDSFSLWYAHFGLGQRSDLAIVVQPLLEYEWYRENINTTYPEIIIPKNKDEIPKAVDIQALNSRPVCTLTLKPTLDSCPSCVADASRVLRCE